MKRRAAVLLACLFAAGCGVLKVKPAPAEMPPKGPLPEAAAHAAEPVAQGSESESRREHGDVFVVERRGALYLDATTVIVGSAGDKALVEGLVLALFGGVSPLDRPSVQTLDEYLTGLQRAQTERPVSPPLDLGSIRRDIQADLQGRKAVVYRYVRVPKKADAPSRPPD